MVKQRTGSGHDRIFGEQRGRLVSHGRAGREDSLDDPTVYVASTIGQIKVDHVGCVADDSSDDGVHLHSAAQVSRVGEV